MLSALIPMYLFWSVLLNYHWWTQSTSPRHSFESEHFQINDSCLNNGLSSQILYHQTNLNTVAADMLKCCFLQQLFQILVDQNPVNSPNTSGYNQLTQIQISNFLWQTVQRRKWVITNSGMPLTSVMHHLSAILEFLMPWLLR